MYYTTNNMFLIQDLRTELIRISFPPT
uniref:Uncharacterized protein n=1 Tax=Anguilla anguilla TaxID=7936 RepID=A0A0E9P7V1_ANGAN